MLPSKHPERLILSRSASFSAAGANFARHPPPTPAKPGHIPVLGIFVRPLGGSSCVALQLAV